MINMNITPEEKLNMGIEKEEILHAIKIYNMKAEAYGMELISLASNNTSSNNSSDDEDAKLIESLKTKQFNELGYAITLLKNLGFVNLDPTKTNTSTNWMKNNVVVHIIYTFSGKYKFNVE